MSEDQSSSGSGRRTFLERVSRAFHSEPRDREDLKEVLDEALERGVLDSEARTMMEGALGVSDITVEDAMIPRSQMVVIPRDGKLEDFLPEIIESGHSRFPVVGEDRDEVEGILLAKDLLGYLVTPGVEFDLTKLMRPAVMVPESKPLNQLMRDLRASRSHMALVVDEYGGISGLITLEDVLEEIVGEIADETDRIEQHIVKIGKYEWRVLGKTPIDDFNEAIPMGIQDTGEYDTFSGYILSTIGRIPDVGEEIRIDDFTALVKKMDGNRIKEYIIRKEMPPS